MTPIFNSQDYYKKMLELQEKLRKSEEERIRLEERFNILEQESRIRHEACINKLRMRYIEFLEEQRLRDERNNKLLGTLDRVDSSLALMSAKTDKLSSLRKEYEASSMLRAYVSRTQAGSVTGDSGIVSQNNERRTHKYVQSSSSFPSASNSSVYTQNPLRKIHEYPSTSNFFFSKSLSYSQRPTIDYPEPHSMKPTRDLGTIWGYSTPRLGVSSYPNHDPDKFRRARFLSKDNSPFQYPETICSPKTTKLTSLLTNSRKLEEEKTGGDLSENELDKYINKIRSLHGDLDESIEEVDHEQNTSGDLLNVTLSEDVTVDHLLVEEKPTEQVPQEIIKVIQIADDLASRTIEKNVEYLSEGKPNVHNLSPIDEKQLETQQSDGIESNSKEVSKLEQPECTKIIAKAIKSNVISAPFQMNSKESQDYLTVNNKNADDTFNVEEKEMNDTFFQVAEELEPWNTDNLVAHVEQQVFINQEADPVESKNVTPICDAAKTNLVNEVEVANDKETDKVVQENVIRPNEEEGQPNQSSENNGAAYVTDYQNTASEQLDQNYQDRNTGYDYSNQENNYQYTTDGYEYTQDYTYDTNNQQAVENYDSTVQYPDNYQQDTSVQYYSENVQYQTENYEQDPNAQYNNENYPQVSTEYQYQEDHNKNQGEYSAVNQEYNMGNYDYNYEQGEGYQAENYQEYPTVDVSEIKEQTMNEEPLISSVKEQDQVIEKNNKKKDFIKSILESETTTESSIEKNTLNTESDFDFN